jgi:dipeptidase E
MKLLLTSAGISNPSIAKALIDLVGKRPEETTIAFVPTAANVEMGDKGWFISDLARLKDQGFKSIDIADISALEPNVWKQKFEAADVLFFEGGNTYHLMHWMNQSGLTPLLREYLQTKVYVGVSAGSMVVAPDLILKISQIVYGEDLDQTEEMAALGLVDFYVLPHLGSQDFENVTEPIVRKAAANIGRKTYVLDDQSAIKVIDGVAEVVSEGKWFEINETI